MAKCDINMCDTHKHEVTKNADIQKKTEEKFRLSQALGILLLPAIDNKVPLKNIKRYST